MPKHFEITGPAFVGLLVRDVQASAHFYEQTLGLRRDAQVFPNGSVAFHTYPIPFGLSPLPPNIDGERILRPILAPSIWFKTANSQVVHDALLEAGVTMVRALSEGRFGRQFTFLDPDDYAITIYDRDAPPDGWDQTAS